jgi:hypothetical protein
VRQGAKGISRLQVNEVFGCLGRNQFGFRRRTPAIGFGTKILNLLDRGLGTKKLRHVRGQIRRRKAVDEAMAFIAPGAGCGRMKGEAPGHDKDCKKSTLSRSLEQHEASIRPGEEVAISSPTPGVAPSGTGLRIT